MKWRWNYRFFDTLEEAIKAMEGFKKRSVKLDQKNGKFRVGIQSTSSKSNTRSRKR
jgi:hypothetical protein